MQSAGVLPANENGVVTRHVALLNPGLPRPNSVVPTLKKFAHPPPPRWGAQPATPPREGGKGPAIALHPLTSESEPPSPMVTPGSCPADRLRGRTGRWP